MTKRKTFSSSFKAKVAIEALQEKSTIAELSSRHSIHSTQIKQWRSTLEKSAANIFIADEKNSEKHDKKHIEQLYQRLGELEFANNVLKKKLIQ